VAYQLDKGKRMLHRHGGRVQSSQRLNVEGDRSVVGGRDLLLSLKKERRVNDLGLGGLKVVVFYDVRGRPS